MTIPIMVLRIYILRLVENQMERGLSARFPPRMTTLRSNAIRIKTCNPIQILAFLVSVDSVDSHHAATYS